MSELLSLLHAGAPWAYLWTDQSEDENGHGTSLWYRPAEGLPSIPADWRNRYFGVHGCHSRGGGRQRSGQGGARLAGANCFYADFDAKSYPRGLDDIWAHLERLPRRRLAFPTAVVLSGGGLHCYWVFEDGPVSLLRPLGRDRFARAQRLWVDQVVRADPSAKDLGRVLRLPGSCNHKYTPPRRVEVAEFNRYRLYRVRDLAAMLRPYIELEEAQQRIRAEQATDEAKKQPQAWRQLVRWAYMDALKGERHRVGLRLAFRLKEAGCPESIAGELVEDFIADTVKDRPTKGEAKGMTRYAYR